MEYGGHPGDLRLLLKECVEEGTLDGLVCVRRMYEHMYGRMTYNYEIKAPAASTLLVWRDVGLKALTEAAKKYPEVKNTEIALALLSSLAAGEGLPSSGEVGEPIVDSAIRNTIENWPDLLSRARASLVEIILSIPDDDDVALRVGLTLMQSSMTRRLATRELFAAASTRWLAVSTPVLDRFDELIKTRPKDEPVFQNFLSNHPQLPDPLAIRVWPKPDLFGFKEPDYIVQRADGTYMVVEIECPGKPLVTSGGHLSADVTHAEQQATDYRRTLLRKYADLRVYLPGFQEPDCLVVVGVERDLDEAQKQVLHDANRNRTHLRIVGFDWLLDRGRTIASNMTHPRVEVLPLRIV
ncbi:Shedu anti-phage system protein SduA domain-containing protein [Paracraurococcus lichenis]|uniref:DUF4263 domain-containing protein n=1 Tax=Paracraurococcus lichenis TaxID=3064888 RepID=A0ABT9EAG7_9PROT|nr:Shedu anti-phage system protein SduA domain-containing protein [Paracraurococcus sp. LOR1-02]MDO9713161.1 DUF4263 domain-containing protein [Paracraurococcus sp. LOR1-02]